LLTVAQVAALEPETLPKMPQARMLTCSSGRDAPHPWGEAVEQLLAQAGAEQDLAHPDEHRQGGERPASVLSQ
jgi:hypothetical protein